VQARIPGPALSLTRGDASRGTVNTGLIRRSKGESAMNMDATSAYDASAEPADATARLRRAGLALALMVAPWGFVLANLSYAWATRAGGSDDTGAGALAIAAAHPALDRFGQVAAMLGAMLMVPASIGAMRLTHRHASRLGLIGGLLVGGAYIAYFAMVASDRFVQAMAARGDQLQDYARIIDDSLNGASVVWYFLLFALGNLVGTFLLGLALLRSHQVPAWAASFVMAWSALHVAGLAAGSEWFEVAGATLQSIGFAVVGLQVLRQPLPGETRGTNHQRAATSQRA